MSVTVSIENNRDYCKAHHLIQITQEDCFCAYKAGEAQPDCPDCNGTGKEMVSTVPFEMNLANANFSTFWSALGLDIEDWSGFLDARIVLERLKSFDEALALRAGGVDGIVIESGLDAERVASYVEKLTGIAREAERREEKIFWY